MRLGDSAQLAAVVRSLPGAPVTWVTSDDTVLTVSAAGLVRAVGPGTATISAVLGPARDTMSVAVSVRFASLAMSRGGVVCAVATTGDAFCRGPNFHGMLGNGSTVDYTAFVRVAGRHTFATVIPGVQSTCGLTTDSAAYCWGYGAAGALGVGDTNTRLVPTPVSGARRFERIAVGDLHACGLSARSAYCWGWNDYGQIGDTAFENAATPRAVPGPSFVELAAGGWGTCGVTGAHATYCWGLNYFGQLGTYTDTVFHTPVPMAGSHAFRSLAIREMQCGVATSGTVFCWGLPFALSPMAIAGGLPFTSISTAYTHGCGIATDSTARCWTWRMQPGAVPGGLKLVQLASGNYHDCGVTADSSAYCWLYNCGYSPDVVCNDPPVPAVLAAGTKFTEVAAGGDNESCGLAAGGAVFCWYVDRDAVRSPVIVPGGTTFLTVAVGSGAPPSPIQQGSQYGCGIAADSSGQCWGFRRAIQGNQLIVETSVPTPVPGGLKYISLDTWGGHVCGIAVGGSAYCWTPPDVAPVLVPGGGNYTSVYADYWSNCALDATGAAACWGRNLDGELGIGSAGIQSRVPVPVLGGHAFTTMAMEMDHTCGLATDSTAYCWGSNSSGMLGTGDTAWSTQPVPVAGGFHFAALSAGPHLTCGLLADGSAYCWGRGTRTPTEQQVGTHFISLSANSYSTICGVTTAGDVQCWDPGPYEQAAARRAVRR